MRAYVTLIAPRTAVSRSEGYASLDVALAAADENEEDFFVIVEMQDGKVVRDTRPEEWLMALHPEDYRS